MKKIGFIGCGNMAGAIIGGIISSGLLKKEEIMGAEIFEAARKNVAQKFDIEVTDDNKKLATESEIIVLSVKPQFYVEVIEEIRPIISKDTIVLTIAPGFSLDKLAGLFAKGQKIIRAMPNTPALIGEGMTAVCPNKNITADELEWIKKLLASCGRVEVVKEYMMDAVVSASGSAPAYVYIMIEAMADAAVMDGMPRAKAYQFAAQAVVGAAKMVLETGKHPAELKDAVCSPAGTTIEAVRVLEEKGFRSAIIEAMRACADKSHRMA